MKEIYLKIIGKFSPTCGKENFVSFIITGEKGVIYNVAYSVTRITLRNSLVLLHYSNALGLWREVIASKSYRSGHKEAVIAIHVAIALVTL
jgi:hypothetical protein